MDDEYDRQEAASSSSSAVCSKCNSGMTAVAELAVEAGIGGGGGYTSFTDSTHRCISLTVLECCGTGVASDSSAVVRGGEGSSPALSWNPSCGEVAKSSSTSTAEEPKKENKPRSESNEGLSLSSFGSVGPSSAVVGRRFGPGDDDRLRVRLASGEASTSTSSSFASSG